MDNYERQIGLKTIKLTFIRRWLFMILLFVPIAAGTYIVTNFFMTKTYSSTAAYAKTNAAFNAATYNKLLTLVNTDTVYTVVETRLAEDGVKHSGGAAITAKEIKSGISFAAMGTNSFTVSFSFKSKDNTIVQKVAQKVVDVGVETAVTNSDFTTLYNSSKASAAAKSSNERKYLIIGLAAGAVIALGVPFVYEIVADEIYDAKDIAAWGAEGFDLKVTYRKKEEEAK